MPRPGSFGEDSPLVHRVLKVHVRSCSDQTPGDVLVTEHGRRVQSRPLRPTRHHLHVRLSSRFKKTRYNLHVPTHSSRINQRTVSAAPPSGTPVSPGPEQLVEEVTVASGGSMLERHPKPLLPLVWCSAVGDEFEYLYLQPFQ
ncbi:unnamed protein product [Ectocarpus sp. 13 AM-2016]